jgi:hypothetical protein
MQVAEETCLYTPHICPPVHVFYCRLRVHACICVYTRGYVWYAEMPLTPGTTLCMWIMTWSLWAMAIDCGCWLVYHILNTYGACMQVANAALLGLSVHGMVVDTAALTRIQNLRLLRMELTSSKVQNGVELSLPLLRMLKVVWSTVLGRSLQLHVRSTS